HSALEELGWSVEAIVKPEPSSHLNGFEIRRELNDARRGLELDPARQKAEALGAAIGGHAYLRTKEKWEATAVACFSQALQTAGALQ
ncbi:unnamed protein product, partial [Durusdinium trenchii]